MSKKLTMGFIRGEFEKEGYILLTEEYINAHQKLEYICPKGYIGMIRWSGWQQGHRCAGCFGNKKLTIGFVREHFEKEGYTLLSKRYTGCAQKLKYMCPVGHPGSIRWYNWKYGYRCSECGGSKQLTIEFVREQFEKEDYILLTKEYINNKTQLEYICPNKHNRITTWDNWQQGKRCGRCRFDRNKGSGNPSYNSDLTEADRINGRYMPGYEEWKYKVKERDIFTCQVCGQLRGNIVSHHLESYNNNSNLRIELSNGVCLCEKCHKEFHFMYGYGDNTRKQFEKFKLNTGA